DLEPRNQRSDGAWIQDLLEGDDVGTHRGDLPLHPYAIVIARIVAEVPRHHPELVPREGAPVAGRKPTEHAPDQATREEHDGDRPSNTRLHEGAVDREGASLQAHRPGNTSNCGPLASSNEGARRRVLPGSSDVRSVRSRLPQARGERGGVLPRTRD